MSTHATDAIATGGQDPVRDKAGEAFVNLGCPADVVAARLVSANATADLLRDSGAGKFLVVGGDIGVGAMALALANPGVEIVVVDPDLPLSAEMARAVADRLGANAPSTSLALAAAAARQLGVSDRIRFVPGGFSGAEVTASTLNGVRDANRERTRIIGPRVCAEEGPFAGIVIEGLATTEATTADIRLAASALTPDGVMALRGCVGERGAAIRAGVFEFLRYNPDHVLEHPPHAWPGEAPGVLRLRRGVLKPTVGAPLTAQAREAIAGLVALALGDRPVLEVAVGAPVLGAERRARGLPVRTLRLTAQDWGARYFDPLIDQIMAALDHTPGSTLFSGDLLDVAPDEMVAKLCARLADRKATVMLAVTPPGEAGVAGPMSRPAARVIDLASGQGLTAYGLAGQELEGARHRRDGAEEGDLGSTSRFASLVLLAGRDGWRDTRGRALSELTPAAAAQREQTELQRIHVQSVLRAKLEAEAEAARGAGRERDEVRAELLAANEKADAARRGYEDEIDRLEAAIRQLDTDVAAITRERDRLVEDLRRETQARLAVEADIPPLEDEIERLKQLYAAETGRLTQLYTDETSRLSGLYSGAASARDGFAADAEHERQARVAAETRIGELEQETFRTARLFADAAAARDDLAAELAAETKRRDAVEAQLRAALAALQGEHGQLKDANQREIGALKAKLAVASEWERSTLLSIEALKSTHGGEIAKFKAGEATLSAAAARATRELDGARSELGKLKGDLARVRSELADVQAELRRARADLDAAQQKLRETDIKLSSAMSSKGGAEMRVHDLQAELGRLRNGVMAREKELADIRVVVAARNAALADAAAEVEMWESETEALRKQLDEAKARSQAGEGELFAPMDVEGIDAHLALSQKAIDEFRAGRPLVEPAHVPYPRKQELKESGPAETHTALASSVKRLHGRAADLSRDINMLLSDASRADEEGEAARRREIVMREMSHSEAVERVRLDVATRLAAHEKEASAVDARLGAAERAARELKRAILPGQDIDAPGAMLDLLPAPTQAMRLGMLSASLEHLHHVLDARRLAAREAEEAAAASAASADIPATHQSIFRQAVSAVHPTTPIESWTPPTPVAERKTDLLSPARRWLHTYLETVRLVDLRTRINRELAPLGLAARLFDPDIYRLSGDIAPYGDPLRHYLERGEAEGRKPLALFDPAYYQANNPDAAKSGRSLLAHFFGVGVRQGRAPCAALSTLPAMADEAGMGMLEFFVRSEQKAAQAARSGGKPRASII